MRVAPWMVLMCALPAFGQVPPPAPLAAQAQTPWACTVDTLFDEGTCTIDGRTVAQQPSLEQAKENQRQARVVAEDACARIARAGAVPDDALLKLCRARIDGVAGQCGGDGSRRLLDDAGRFNPGHARCYGALSTMLTEVADPAVVLVAPTTRASASSTAVPAAHSARKP